MERERNRRREFVNRSIAAVNDRVSGDSTDRHYNVWHRMRMRTQSLRESHFFLVTTTQAPTAQPCSLSHNPLAHNPCLVLFCPVLFSVLLSV